MNVDKFFEKYSIEEISKRTKISPISLRFIKNKEFEKIPRAKFMGFLKIIEKEFNVNLDELREEYDLVKKEEKEIKIEVEKEKSNNFLFIAIGVVLLGIGGYFLLKNSPKKPNQISNPTIINSQEINNTTEKNSTEKNETKLTLNSYKQISPIKLPKTKKEVNKTKKITKYEVTIIPYEKVWYRALNIETNKTFEYLTSKIKVLPKGDYYIKFGHGNVSILYNEYNITPNTKKIIRILLKDGNYTYMKKPNRYEK